MEKTGRAGEARPGRGSGGELEKAALTLEAFSAGDILQFRWPRQKVKTMWLRSKQAVA